MAPRRPGFRIIKRAVDREADAAGNGRQRADVGAAVEPGIALVGNSGKARRGSGELRPRSAGLDARHHHAGLIVGADLPARERAADPVLIAD